MFYSIVTDHMMLVYQELTSDKRLESSHDPFSSEHTGSGGKLLQDTMFDQ